MKRCPYCAEEIQDAAIKCRFCGSMLTGAAPPSPGPAIAGGPAAQGAGSAAAPGDTAGPVPIFGGSPSWKARFGSHIAAVLLCLIGLGLGPALPVVAHVALPVGLASGGALLLVGLVWLAYLTLARRSVRYQITNRTIDVESGVLARKIETLQLWKIRDIELRQSFLDRILNVATIYIVVHDVSDPKLTLWGMPESREIFERIKDAIELARQSRNVIGLVD